MVEIQNLSKAFENKQIFENFSYAFDNSGLYAIVGESGRGKTTLLRMIAHLDGYQKGTIKSPKRIAYSFQEYRLFPQLSVLSNIEAVAFRKSGEENIRKITHYLERLGLDDASDLFPAELSGGMKQRVSLIRAFVCDAPVVLLDEPFKELDTNLVDIVVEIIQELARDKLVIFTAHSEEFSRQIGACIVNL